MPKQLTDTACHVLLPGLEGQAVVEGVWGAHAGGRRWKKGRGLTVTRKAGKAMVPMSEAALGEAAMHVKQRGLEIGRWAVMSYALTEPPLYLGWGMA
jgi:hypothetical protein